MKPGWLLALGTLLLGAELGLGQAPLPVVTPEVMVPVPAGVVEGLPTEVVESPSPSDGGAGLLFWVNPELLLWRTKPTPIRTPLLTTGSLTDRFPGALDQPGTRVLFGNQDVDYGLQPGLRVNGGVWLPGGLLGLEGSILAVTDGARHVSYFGDATGTPLLGHPFVNALNGTENLSVISGPASLFGAPYIGGTAITTSSSFWGYDLSLAIGLVREGPFRVKALVGYKELALDESLRINDTVAVGAPGTTQLSFGGPNNFVDPPAGLLIGDSFRTRNRFHGGLAGGEIDWALGRMTLSVSTKIGVGNTEESAVVNGFTTLTPPGTANVPPGTLPGGIYAQASNIGRYTATRMALAPEGSVTVSYHFTSWLSACAGYTYLYWSRVARPGNLLDRNINPNQVPSFFEFGTAGGPAQPGFQLRDSDYWAKGVTLELEFRF